MADSIQLYNGYNNINVNTLDILREPNQQLANAIATGPQDEFFSKLEECNRVFTCQSNNDNKLSVTPSWNWRPGTLDMIKEYVAKQLMLEKKSSGLGKYISRSEENARYKLSWMSRKLTECEDIKRMLKREGYAHDVNIEEYIVKLADFCDKVEESVNQASKATDNKVILNSYIHIPENNERLTTFYIDCYIKEGEMSICQDSEVLQKLPMEGIKIMFYCSLRKMMKYLDRPSASSMDVAYRGLYDVPMTGSSTYRANQVFSHPYIAQPRLDASFIRWATTCFSNFTDNIRKAFHDLNFIVLSMELLEWSSYYNISHSNPYNQPNMMHFGMSNRYSKTYQAAMNRDTDNCASRVRGLMQTKNARDFSKQNIRDRINIVEHCQKSIDCIWRNDCHLFKNYADSLAKIADEENNYKYESILGALIEHFDKNVVSDILYEDMGCYLDDDWENAGLERDNILYDYEDALNHMIAQYKNIDFFIYLLNEMNYWNKEEEEAIPFDEDITGEDENIKRAMLQWATGRGL